jgi:hypothetical protein
MRPQDQDVEQLGQAAAVHEDDGHEPFAASPARRISRLQRASLGETVIHAGLLGLLMGTPLIGHPPVDDDRFDVFRWGAYYSEYPLRLIPDQLSQVNFHLTSHGNFRPFGRILERAQDSVVWEVSTTFGIPMHIVLRGFFAVSMALFAMAVVFLVGSFTRSGSNNVSATTALAPVSLAALFVASGMDAPVVNFSDLYLQTMALVLLICAYFAREYRITSAPLRRRLGRHVGWFSLGLLTASFNELALLALPMVLAVFGTRVLLMDRLRPREALRTERGRLLVSYVAGFSIIFVPIRYLVLHLCATTACYAPSLLIVTSESPKVALDRAMTWLPSQAWRTATAGSGTWWTRPPVPTVFLIILACWITARCLQVALSANEDDRRERIGLTFLGVTLIALGAALGGSTALLLIGHIEAGEGWRDTIVTMIGGSLALASFTAAVLRRGRGVGRSLTTMLIFVLWSAVLSITLMANAAWTETMRLDDDLRPYVRMSLALTDPDTSPQANDVRCEILQPVLMQLDAEDPVQAYEFERLEEALDTAAQAMIGMDFCYR